MRISCIWWFKLESFTTATDRYTPMRDNFDNGIHEEKVTRSYRNIFYIWGEIPPECIANVRCEQHNHSIVFIIVSNGVWWMQLRTTFLHPGIGDEHLISNVWRSKQISQTIILLQRLFRLCVPSEPNKSIIVIIPLANYKAYACNYEWIWTRNVCSFISLLYTHTHTYTHHASLLLLSHWRTKSQSSHDFAIKDSLGTSKTTQRRAFVTAIVQNTIHIYYISLLIGLFHHLHSIYLGV